MGPAGYSGTPLVKKLGVAEGNVVALVGAPRGFESALAPLPAGAAVRRQLRGSADVVVCFVTWRKDYERRWRACVRALAGNPAGMLWVAWPKKAAKVPTDMNEHVVRDVALPEGWVDNKVCAIDEVWSGLRLVLRRENRPVAIAIAAAK